ncbi:DUF2829 domain-containing protein [Carnobacterium divergens]|uniref:Thoeris anti-defense 2-like domain-containing protein n=2 Tax=Carnobacterium divergens TaxID=2748 RepID=A0A0R2HVX9_CARDV|nr:DUF2829 domain-containing protein [Carnobacterium divergens]ANZ98930.1 hypothetical protein BFC22_01915 [Carnobacterium divergens]KRN56850.1 hypothetical protein IV74_GL000497 [Carnobacterium divergens DSM 20623]MDO0874927.1 DUF2829 domain-containing protein [Carnobacterium divergens]MDT1958552.1 DUF2829 domain-containing protein [Carnobacterium divergens]MDT1974520.1 DUF2829 domain-containing protein [Carnobacterium divergens]
MTFEKILPHLKQGEKVIRSGWGGAELYVILEKESTHQAEKMNPYFLINVTGEGYTMFTPTVCDILAEDWEIVQ